MSPRRLATALGVSESSVKRWTDEGRLAAERTAGGHRRIDMGEAIRYVRKAGLSVVRPELLGLAAPLPSGTDARASTAAESVYRALAADRALEARSLIVSLYVEGSALGWIFDVVVREALARVGELWRHDERGIFVEHRATETCLEALAELRRLVPSPARGAPVAVGGGYADDVYRIPSAMVALVLADVGYEAVDLGPATPVEATLAAVQLYRPALVWQAFSVAPRGARRTVAELRRLAESIGSGPVVVGGRGSTGLALGSVPRVQRLASMTELAAFARGATAAAEG